MDTIKSGWSFSSWTCKIFDLRSQQASSLARLEAATLALCNLQRNIKPNPRKLRWACHNVAQDVSFAGFSPTFHKNKYTWTKSSYIPIMLFCIVARSDCWRLIVITCWMYMSGSRDNAEHCSKSSGELMPQTHQNDIKELVSSKTNSCATSHCMCLVRLQPGAN